MSRGRKLYVDLDSNTFIEAPGLRHAMQSLTLRRGDNARLEIGFCSQGKVVELDEAATGIFGIKPKGKYDGNYLASGMAWTKEGLGEDTVYVFGVNLNTVEINSALHHNPPNDSDDLAVIECMAEIEWHEGDAITSAWIKCYIENDIIKGTEGGPISANPKPMLWVEAPPASPTSTGVPGSAAWDENYVYICTAPNTWRRTAIATWS